MRKIFKVIRFELVALLVFFALTTAYAKRAPAPEVPAVTYHGVNYLATYAHGGVIEAYSVKTKNMLWRKKIYDITYQPQLEKDIQDVFITQMHVKEGRLIIKDEKNHTYALNLKTHKVKYLKRFQ